MTKTLHERIGRVRNLERAWHHLLARDMSDTRLSQEGRSFVGELNKNLRALSEAWLNQHVQLGGFRVQRLQKKGGGYRELHVPDLHHRILDRAVLDVVEPILDRLLSPAAQAYRPGTGVHTALRQAAQLRDEGYTWVAKTDVSRCYDELQRSRIWDALQTWLPDDSLDWWWVTLEQQLLAVKRFAIRGIPQGSAMSPLMMNLALDTIDDHLHTAGFRHVRYADDLVLFGRTRPEAESALKVFEAELRKENLVPNQGKELITNFERGFTWLGQELDMAEPSSEPNARVGERLTVYVAGREKFIRIAKGRMIVQAGKELALSVPIGRLERIVTFGAVGVSGGFRQWALQQNVEQVFLSTNGAFLGTARAASNKWLSRRQTQYAQCSDAEWRCEIAKQMILGKVSSQRALLLRYNRVNQSDSTTVRETQLMLRQTCLDAVSVGTVDQLMGLEGAAAKAYWIAFQCLLPEGLGFGGRVRRPPADVVNAALSLGYTLLVAECEGALAGVGLDPACGVMHSPKQDRASLALDLMEEFRPVIVDSTVLDCMRRGILGLQSATPGADGGIWLTTDGRRSLIKRYEQRMLTVHRDARLDKRVTWRHAIHAQAKHLAVLMHESGGVYEPVRWR